MPGLIRWQHKDLSYPRRALFQVAQRGSRGVTRRWGWKIGGGSHNQPETDNGKEWARSRTE